MIINQIKIENIGIYAGENLFDFGITDEKNIILIGGKNGSGKTTLLDSIKLCLYGDLLFNRDTTKYNNFIKKFIRNGESLGKIELSISYYHMNEKIDLEISRNWEIKNKSIKETLLLETNGAKFEATSKKYWQDYILEIIPYGLINLFFFDGEKIESLAKDLNKVQVSSAIKNLMGISALDYLDNCMELYNNKIIDSSNTDSAVREAINSAETRRNELSNELGHALHERSTLLNNIKILNDKISHLNNELMSVGGNIINDYSSLQTEKDLLQKQIHEVENSIRELASTYLPLTLYMDGLVALSNQLNEESKLYKYNIAQEHIQSKLSDIQKFISDESLFISIKNSLLNFELPDIQIIHGLSETDTKNILSTIDIVQNSVLPRSIELKAKLEELNMQLNDIELAIEKAPRKDILKPLLDKIHKSVGDKGNLEAQYAIADNKVEKLYAEDEKLEKDLKVYRSQIESNIKLQHNVKLLGKSRKVLDKFKDSFIQRRLSILEKYLLDNLQLLSRKRDVINSLQIDPGTFQVNLFDMSGNKISKSRFSAGERQVFAISLLWALSMVSTKLLPTIIDTPLSRLDSDHRSNIVNEYFKRGSHQMIILSTDEEVDEPLYNDIKDNISKQYHLEFEPNNKSTQISTDYFWTNIEATNEVQ
jgi:DNA sulfur modification protein DndD